MRFIVKNVVQIALSSIGIAVREVKMFISYEKISNA